MKTTQHTSQEYESELRLLKERILSMGTRCERLIRQAMQALSERDARLARAVEETDREINADELAVDDMAVRILALRQPVGRDLRFILTALKVVVDLERIGDEAVNVAERAGDLADRIGGPGYQNPELPKMAELSINMLQEALDAYVKEYADKARAVLVSDDVVDELYGQILRDALDFMAKHSERVSSAMAVISCAKYLERIADHATNIAEMVVYMVRGVDVRHKGKH